MGNVCIVGPRDAGKTTFLAALEQYAKLNHRFNIYPVTPDAKRLAAKAEYIILGGSAVEPTAPDQSVYEMPEYLFRIEIKTWWQQLTKQSQNSKISLNQTIFANTSAKKNKQNLETIQLAVRDFAGGVFQQIGNQGSNRSSGFQAANLRAELIPDALFQEFVKYCFLKDVEGALVLLPGWEPGADTDYYKMIAGFLRYREQYQRSQNYRVAIAMSKCERGELWTGRLDPEVDLFERHLPMTRKLLRERLAPEQLAFFAISTFGVMERTDPRPNRRDEIGTEGRRAVLRKRSAVDWQPYGLMAPLYWLSTGKRKNFGY